MSIKFNLYYATTADGPWTLANDTPIDRDIEGNEYTISGLREDTLYYISIVGGLIEDDEFIPLISQPIGPNSIGAGDVGIHPPAPLSARTFTPKLTIEDELSHHFEVV